MVPLHLPPLPPIIVYAPRFIGLIKSLRSLSIIHFSRAARRAYATVHTPILSVRARPFYHMTTRGPSMFLSGPKIIEYLTNGTGGHFLRRHECALRVAELLHCEWSPHSNMTVRWVPEPLRRLCLHYNERYLNHPGDLKINATHLWGILFRRQYSLSDIMKMSHHYIYIQERHRDFDEANGRTLVRRTSSCRNQFGHDFHTIATNISIHLPSNRCMVYACRNLHSRHHGSVGEVSFSNTIMNALGIVTDVITPTSASTNGTQSTNDIFVAYDNSELFRDLEKKSTIGILTMHHRLTTILLTLKQTDPSRAGLKIDPDADGTNFRLRFGFGRLQPTPAPTANCTVIHWNLGSKKMPTISYREFVILPKSLKDELIHVFECAHNFVMSSMPDMFPRNPKRVKCTKKLNTTLGYPKAKMKFEYYDIVITRNIVLPKHIDQKNDHREGYNFCVVYSYYHTIQGFEYKVSIIMTTRSTIGAVLESND